MSFPGDDLVPAPAVVMDRTAVFDATPDQLWPWLVQLGKGRAGWYLPRRVERLLPARHRALRHVDPRWSLAVGDVVPDYGPDGSFTVEVLDPGRALVYSSERRRTTFSWALLVTEASPGRTRLHLRLRVSRAGRVVRLLGDQLDHATVAGLVAGLRERLAEG